MIQKPKRSPPKAPWTHDDDMRFIHKKSAPYLRSDPPRLPCPLLLSGGGFAAPTPSFSTGAPARPSTTAPRETFRWNSEASSLGAAERVEGFVPDISKQGCYLTTWMVPRVCFSSLALDAGRLYRRLQGFGGGSSLSERWAEDPKCLRLECESADSWRLLLSYCPVVWERVSAFVLCSPDGYAAALWSSCSFALSRRRKGYWCWLQQCCGSSWPQTLALRRISARTVRICWGFRRSCRASSCTGVAIGSFRTIPCILEELPVSCRCSRNLTTCEVVRWI